MANLDRIIAAAAARNGVSPDYLRRLIRYESRGDPNAVSSTGASGLTQITRGTARELGISGRSRFDPETNVDAAARYAAKNSKTLERALGRPPTNDELYLGHLLGPGGAVTGLQNPNMRAVDLYGTGAVRVNLPKSMQGSLHDITVKEFQDIHRRNFNRGGGTVDIGTTPDLKTLNPPDPNVGRVNTQSMREISPTESSTMARYPSYDQAINSALDQVSNQGFRNNDGRYQVASFIPPIRGPGGKMRPNPLKPPSNPNKALPKPEDVPGPRTPSPQDEADRIRAAAERQQQLQAAKARVQRGEPPQSPAQVRQQQSGPPIAPPPVQGPPQPGSTAAIQPTPVPTQRITNPAVATGVTGAAGAGAAAVGAAGPDPAVQAVQQSINGYDPFTQAPPGGTPRPSGRPYDPFTQQPPQAMGPGASVQSEASPPAANVVMQQIAPVIREIQKDPAAAQTVQRAAVELTKAKARVDAQRGDMQADPTYYQRQAAMQGGSGDPASDRAMQLAVTRDYQNPYRGPGVGRAPAARGMQTAPASLPQPPQPDQPPPLPMPQNTPYLQGSAQMTPPAMNGTLPQGALDPSMSALMQFFTGGGAP